MDDKTISQAAQAGGGSQLNPDQGSSKTMVAGQKIRIDPRASSPFPIVTSRMCPFREVPELVRRACLFVSIEPQWSALMSPRILLHLMYRGLYRTTWSKCRKAPFKLLFLFSVTLIIAGAQGDHQTGLCELLDPAISLDVAATPETIGLSPRPSTEPVPAERTNGCIPHVVLHAENPGSPDHSGPPSPVGEKLQVGMGFALIVQVGMGLAILVTMGTTAWMLWRRWPTFTEDDINRGLMREPAVARRDDPTFDIPERFPETSNA